MSTSYASAMPTLPRCWHNVQLTTNPLCSYALIYVQAQQLGMRTPQQGAALAAAMAMRGPGPQGEAFVNGGMYLGAAAPTGTPVPLWSSPEWRTESVSASVWEQSQQLVAKWASREADFS